MVFPVSTTPVF